MRRSKAFSATILTLSFITAGISAAEENPGLPKFLQEQSGAEQANSSATAQAKEARKEPKEGKTASAPAISTPQAATLYVPATEERAAQAPGSASEYAALLEKISLKEKKLELLKLESKIKMLQQSISDEGGQSPGGDLQQTGLQIANLPSVIYISGSASSPVAKLRIGMSGSRIVREGDTLDGGWKVRKIGSTVEVSRNGVTRTLSEFVPIRGAMGMSGSMPPPPPGGM